MNSLAATVLYLLPKQAGGTPQIIVFKTLRMTPNSVQYSARKPHLRNWCDTSQLSYPSYGTEKKYFCLNPQSSTLPVSRLSVCSFSVHTLLTSTGEAKSKCAVLNLGRQTD